MGKSEAKVDACGLGDLCTVADFARENAHVFPSETSLRWFIRVNRAELVKAGGLVLLTGRLMIRRDRFANAARTIGQRALEAA
jgi:hypothetical protein